MAKKKPAEGNVGPSGQAAAPPLPPGVKLLRTLEGHIASVDCVALSPDGRMRASKSRDQTNRSEGSARSEVLRRKEARLFEKAGLLGLQNF